MTTTPLRSARHATQLDTAHAHVRAAIARLAALHIDTAARAVRHAYPAAMALVIDVSGWRFQDGGVNLLAVQNAAEFPLWLDPACVDPDLPGVEGGWPAVRAEVESNLVGALEHSTPHLCGWTPTHPETEPDAENIYLVQLPRTDGAAPRAAVVIEPPSVIALGDLIDSLREALGELEQAREGDSNDAEVDAGHQAAEAAERLADELCRHLGMLPGADDKPSFEGLTPVGLLDLRELVIGVHGAVGYLAESTKNGSTSEAIEAGQQLSARALELANGVSFYLGEPASS